MRGRPGRKSAGGGGARGRPLRRSPRPPAPARRPAAGGGGWGAVSPGPAQAPPRRSREPGLGRRRPAARLPRPGPPPRRPPNFPRAARPPALRGARHRHNFLNLESPAARPRPLRGGPGAHPPVRGGRRTRGGSCPGPSLLSTPGVTLAGEWGPRAPPERPRSSLPLCGGRRLLPAGCPPKTPPAPRDPRASRALCQILDTPPPSGRGQTPAHTCPAPPAGPPARRSAASLPAPVLRSRGRPSASVPASVPASRSRRAPRYSMARGDPACGAHRTRGDGDAVAPPLGALDARLPGLRSDRGRFLCPRPPTSGRSPRAPRGA